MKRIIKADATGETYQAQTMPLDLDDVAAEAKRLLSHARRQADRIVAEAAQEAAAVAAEAKQKGYAEGLARGRNEGSAEANRSLRQEAGEKLATDSAQLTAMAQEAVSQLAAARGTLLAAAKAELLDLAIEIATQVVGRVAAADVGAAQANLARCLDRLGETAEAVVHVNPAQLAQLQESLPEMVAAMAGGQVRLVGDEGVAQGGVKVLSGRGQMDATVQTLLANVVDSLRAPAVVAPFGHEPETDHERF